MNPNYNIAVDSLGFIRTANLYFFSWIALGTIVYIFGSIAQEYTGMRIGEVIPPKKSGCWYGLCASSIVVMATAVRLFQSRNCADVLEASSQYCRRTKFGISLGVVSFVFSVFTAWFLTHGMGVFGEFIVASLLLFLWIFGVGFITFGSAPGATIGNLYFATWISFILTVFLFAQAFRGYLSPPVQQSEEHNESGANGNEDFETSPAEVPDEEDI
jgi:hypothetical protein